MTYRQAIITGLLIPLALFVTVLAVLALLAAMQGD